MTDNLTPKVLIEEVRSEVHPTQSQSHLAFNHLGLYIQKYFSIQKHSLADHSDQMSQRSQVLRAMREDSGYQNR